MRASTLIVKQGISIKELLAFMAVEDEVSKAVRELGYPVILVDTSEYRKLDGGLSCLSLRF